MKGPRHDPTAHDRQRKLAPLLLLANLGIAAAAAIIMLLSDWGPDPTGLELGVFVALLVISWLTLLVAAGAVGGLAWVLSAVRDRDDTEKRDEEARKPPIDAKFLARRRMFFYYTGVFTNLFAFALAAEVTGGLAESPFIALLVAFVLTSQELSRFREQATAMFGAGLLVVVLMLLCESITSDPSRPAPHSVEIAMVLLAFVGGGILGLIEKQPNPRPAPPDPSQA